MQPLRLHLLLLMTAGRGEEEDPLVAPTQSCLKLSTTLLEEDKEIRDDSNVF